MFIGQDADCRRLPVVLLSGFLGSGKTTLVNAMLRDPALADTAVAINEFGQIPLDQHLIEHGQDRTLVMANGCLCCNLSGDLEDAVMRLFSRRESTEIPRFKRLIIEPSGLADPAPIAQAILRNPLMSRVLRLEAIVTVVDAVFAETQLARHPESLKQIGLADTLLLTKTDRVEPADVQRLASLLSRLNPHAAVLTASYGALEASKLFPAGFLEPDAIPSRALRNYDAGPPSDDHTHGTAAVSLVADAPLRWRAFDAWLRGVRIEHAEALLRVKGLLNVAEAQGPIVVQGVHHVVDAPVELRQWPDADRRTRVVLITRGVPFGAIEASWKAALPRIVAGPVRAAAQIEESRFAGH